VIVYRVGFSQHGRNRNGARQRRYDLVGGVLRLVNRTANKCRDGSFSHGVSEVRIEYVERSARLVASSSYPGVTAVR
jgi:hypothetical protein